MEPFDEALEGSDLACGNDEDGAVRLVLRAATQIERTRALSSARAEPDALDAAADDGAARSFR